MPHVFLFGRTPSLSAAELLAVLRSRSLETRGVQYGPIWAIVPSLDEAMIPSLQRQLGGTVKIGEVVGEGTDLEQLLSVEQLFTHVPNDPRMEFGISGYPEERNFGARLKKIAIARKKTLLAQGYGVRVVTSTAPALSSAAVKKNRLLTQGAELMVFADHGSYVLAITKTVQDYAGFADRDAQRKHSDAKSGMLPPQLARTMVNLAEAKPGSTILDPFCGSGTVLIEARDLGLHVIGSDISAKAIRDSEKNLAAQESTTRWHLVHSDVTLLEKNLPERNVHAIVTEPFLGPPQRREVIGHAQQDFFEKLRTLYRSASQACAAVLAPHGRIVFVFPVLTAPNGPVVYPFLDEILIQQNLRIVQPLPPDAVSVYREFLTTRNSLFYGRRGQHVMREILLLEKGTRDQHHRNTDPS